MHFVHILLCSDYEIPQLPRPTGGTQIEPYTPLPRPAVSQVHTKSRAPAEAEAGTAAVGDDGGYEIALSDFVAPSPPADVNTYDYARIQ